MAKVLVVDDSAVDRLLAGKFLEEAGFTAVYANNGREALESLKRELPDLVLTDLQMPELDGLELVQEIRARHPLIPVILMTAHGSEEIAVTALKSGAASYVPKKKLARNLGQTVATVLDVAKVKREQQRVFDYLTQTESRFVLSNEDAGIQRLVGFLQDNLRQVNLCEETELVRVGTALHEALVNAVEHGNLELSSELRESDDDRYRKLADERSQQSPYKDRQVRVTARITPSQVTYVISDDGPGFDPSTLPDPTDPANLEKVSGRGLLLIRLFMDEVTFNQTGNEVTLVKNRDPERKAEVEG